MRGRWLISRTRRRRWSTQTHDLFGIIYRTRCRGGRAVVRWSPTRGAWLARTDLPLDESSVTAHRTPAGAKRAALRRLGCGR